MPERLVFLDKNRHQYAHDPYPWAQPEGPASHWASPVPLLRQPNPDRRLIAGGTGRAWVLPGPMDRSDFDTYIEHVLAPELEPGTVVILGNLAVHKSEKASKIPREHGCWLLYLPPYSPDLNPIEMAFSKLEAYLRRIGARTFDQLLHANGSICDMFTPEECWN